jgi:hypothetical protein
LRSLSLVWPAALVLAFGCASERLGPDAGEGRLSQQSYRPDRREYLAFREGFPGVLEPNYLPFMVHRKPGDDASGDLLLFCRWPAEAMPLTVYVEEAVIPAALQNEFDPVDPGGFTQAVVRALETWEAELEGLVLFQQVDAAEEALLKLRVLAEEAPRPEPDVRVLGATEALRRACEPHGWDPDSERLEVSFRVPEAVLYAADDFGLLTETQVEAIAVHEIGHALGMLGHSPIPTDLMYRVLGEHTSARGLSDADVNSFVSLYRLPNGTHYGHVSPDAASPRPVPGAPSGGVELSFAPHVDARLGFELRTPAGWLRAVQRHGFFTANGPIWDHDVSFEVFVWPYATLEEYLERFGPQLFAGTWRRYSAPVVVAGRRARAVAVEDASGQWALGFHFVELGDGRVMVLLAVCPVDVEKSWRPWFEAVLASLEIWSDPAQGKADDAADGAP